MCPSGCRLGDIWHLRSCLNFNASQIPQKLFTNSSEAAASSVRVCQGEEIAHRSDILLQLTLLVGSCFYSVSSVSYLKTTKTLSRTIVQNSSANTWPWALSWASYSQSCSLQDFLPGTALLRAELPGSHFHQDGSPGPLTKWEVNPLLIAAITKKCLWISVLNGLIVPVNKSQPNLLLFQKLRW